MVLQYLLKVPQEIGGEVHQAEVQHLLALAQLQFLLLTQDLEHMVILIPIHTVVLTDHNVQVKFMVEHTVGHIMPTNG